MTTYQHDLTNMVDSLTLSCLAGTEFSMEQFGTVRYEWLRSHRVHLLMHEKVPNDVLCDRFGTEPERQSQIAITKLDALETKLNPVLVDMSNAGVSVIVAKGADLRYSAYPTAISRPAADVDLLVPQDAVGIASSVLFSHGFSEFAGLGPHAIRRSYDYELGFISDETFVDLHWDLTPRLGIPRFCLANVHRHSEHVSTRLGPYRRMHFGQAWIHLVWHTYDTSALSFHWPLDDAFHTTPAYKPDRLASTVRMGNLVDLALLAGKHRRDDFILEVRNIANHTNTVHAVVPILQIMKSTMPATFEYLNLDEIGRFEGISKRGRHSMLRMFPQQLRESRLPLIRVRLVRILEVFDFLIPSPVLMRSRYGSNSIRHRILHFGLSGASLALQFFEISRALSSYAWSKIRFWKSDRHFD